MSALGRKQTFSQAQIRIQIEASFKVPASIRLRPKADVQRLRDPSQIMSPCGNLLTGVASFLRPVPMTQSQDGLSINIRIVSSAATGGLGSA